MKFSPIRCPECGQPARGTVEEIVGCAEFSPREGDEGGEGGEVEYSGYTKVWWDDQRTVTAAGGRVRLVCPDAHEWCAVDEDEEGIPAAETPPRAEAVR